MGGGSGAAAPMVVKGDFAGVISGKPIPIVNYTDKAVDGVGKDFIKLLKDCDTKEDLIKPWL